MSKIRWPASRPRRVLVIAGGLLVLCLCSIVGAALFTDSGPSGTATGTPEVGAAAGAVDGERAPAVVASEEPAATARASATPRPTRTPRPSATVGPTRTPRPSATIGPTETPRPSATPRPTRTPRPTQTPRPTDAPTAVADTTPQLSAAEQAYLLTLGESIGRFTAANQDLTDLSGQAGKNIGVILTIDWKVNVAVAMQGMRSALDEMRALQPPARFAGVQKELLTAARLYDTSLALYTEGVDNVDVAKLNQAAASMGDANAAVTRASAEMQRAIGAQPENPAPAATVAESAGLGARRVTWEAAHRASGESAGFYEYDADQFAVLFMGDRVWYMERNHKPGVPLEDARGVVAGFLPADARLVRTYSPEGSPELTVDLYTSEQLAQLVPAAEWWNGEAPGTFIAIFGVYDGLVSRWILAAGNHP